jgi:hypothetical protein
LLNRDQYHTVFALQRCDFILILQLKDSVLLIFVFYFWGKQQKL